MNSHDDTIQKLLVEALTTMQTNQQRDAQDLQKAIHLLEEAVPKLRHAFLEANAATASEDIRKSLRDCVSQLQFDDILQQLLRSIQQRNVLIGKIAECSVAAQTSGSDAVADCYQYLTEYQTLMETSSSIEQESMATGTTELF